MAVDIQEAKAILVVSHSNDGYTEYQMFKFVIPISEDYEVSFDPIVSIDGECIKHYTNGIEMKYAQGVLYLTIECTDEQGFFLEVHDTEHTYKAMRHYKNNEQIDAEGIKIYFIEGQEK